MSRNAPTEEVAKVNVSQAKAPPKRRKKRVRLVVYIISKLETVDILKIDCEGCEVAMERDIIREDPRFLFHVDQISIKTHVTKTWIKTREHFLLTICAKINVQQVFFASVVAFSTEISSFSSVFIEGPLCLCSYSSSEESPNIES